MDQLLKPIILSDNFECSIQNMVQQLKSNINLETCLTQEDQSFSIKTFIEQNITIILFFLILFFVIYNMKKRKKQKPIDYQSQNPPMIINNNNKIKYNDDISINDYIYVPKSINLFSN